MKSLSILIIILLVIIFILLNKNNFTNKKISENFINYKKNYSKSINISNTIPDKLTVKDKDIQQKININYESNLPTDNQDNLNNKKTYLNSEIIPNIFENKSLNREYNKNDPTLFKNNKVSSINLKNLQTPSKIFYNLLNNDSKMFSNNSWTILPDPKGYTVKFNLTTNKSENISIKNEINIYLRNFTLTCKNFCISDQRCQILTKYMKLFLLSFTNKNTFNDISNLHYLNLIDNTINRISIETAISGLSLIYCLLNQDKTSIDNIYQNIFNTLGPITHFIIGSDYQVHSNGKVLVRIPISSNNVFDKHQMMFIYESLRDNNGIVHLNKLSNMIYYTRLFNTAILRYVLTRYSVYTDIALKFDKNLANYATNLEKLLNSETIEYLLGKEDETGDYLQFDDDENIANNLKPDDILDNYFIEVTNMLEKKNIKNKTVNPSTQPISSSLRSSTEKYLWTSNTTKDNDTSIQKNKKRNNWSTLPPVLNRPLKWKAQRPWINTVGPDFLHNNYTMHKI